MSVPRAAPGTGVEPMPPPSPTRRRLLALLAALPVADPASTVGAGPAPASTVADPDTVRQLFTAFRDRVAEHERAFQRCGRLEARLAAEVGYPRVRLPRVPGQPARYAADDMAIAETVPPGPRRERLRGPLRRRGELWDAAARACGLGEARDREDALFAAMRATFDALHAVPAASLTDVLLKLVAVLSLEAPGPAFHHASPWRELHRILADLGALAIDGGGER